VEVVELAGAGFVDLCVDHAEADVLGLVFEQAGEFAAGEGDDAGFNRGDAQQTPLNLRFVTYTDNTNDSTAVTSAVEQGLFILDGYCGGQQGTGLLRTAGSYGVSSISPDPVTGSAMVSYQVGNDGHVQLGLYDALGNEVMELVNTDQKAGGYTTPFNASNLSDGAYIMELRSGSHREIKQVVVMK